jgi:hypothetical protein
VRNGQQEERRGEERTGKDIILEQEVERYPLIHSFVIMNAFVDAL